VTQLADIAVVAGLRTERTRAAGDSAHADVRACLAQTPRRLPARLLYDAAGFELLEALWQNATFYPARLERELLGGHALAIASQLGARARVIEPWHGDVERSIRILSLLNEPAVYIPIDGNASRLATTAERVRDALPSISVRPAVTLDEVLPRSGGFATTVAMLPGTTLGSLEPSHAVRLLTLLATFVGEEGSLLLGADATSDPAALAAAYESPAAERWAMRAIVRIADEGALVDPDAFAYRIVWNPSANRLDLVLEARRRHAIVVGGEAFPCEVGDHIVVDHRYQHTTEAVHAMLGIAGWQARSVLTATPEPMRIWLCDRWRRHRRR